MRGEELDGLTVEDLQRLEKNLESGLSRVVDRKVTISVLTLEKALQYLVSFLTFSCRACKNCFSLNYISFFLFHWCSICYYLLSSKLEFQVCAQVNLVF